MYDVLMIYNALSEKNKILYTYDKTLVIMLIVMFISGVMIYIQSVLYVFETLIHRYKNCFIIRLMI